MNTQTASSMQVIGKVALGALALFLWTATPVLGQQQDDEHHSDPEKTSEKARPPTAEKSSWEGDSNVRSTHENHRESERQAGHEPRSSQRTETSRSDGAMYHGGGRRLNDRDFKRHFGYNHRFRPGWIGGGYSLFVYNGYTFELVDDWPYGWAYTDQCYVVDQGGGYVLMNPRYPGASVGVIIQ